jgi:hypothetical protein
MGENPVLYNDFGGNKRSKQYWLGDLGVDGRMILKLIVKAQDERLCILLIILKARTCVSSNESLSSVICRGYLNKLRRC